MLARFKVSRLLAVLMSCLVLPVFPQTIHDGRAGGTIIAVVELTTVNSIDIDLPAGFDVWEVIILGLRVAADDAPVLQLRSGGSTQVTGYHYTTRRHRDGANATVTGNDMVATSLALTLAIVNYEVDSANGALGSVIRIFSPDDTGYHKTAVWTSTYEGETNQAVVIRGCGYWGGGTGALDGITVLTLGANNMTAGKISVVGHRY